MRLTRPNRIVRAHPARAVYWRIVGKVLWRDGDISCVLVQ